MPFNYRKSNTLAFRGRLMSLLVLTHSGVSPRPHLPQESRIFHLLGQIIIIVYSVFLYSSQFHKRFNLFIILSTASLIGTEGGDSWVWDCALLVPSKTIAITRPTENICGNSKRSSVGRTIVQSHEPWDPGVRSTRRLKPCPRQSRHCESGLLEQISTLVLL